MADDASNQDSEYKCDVCNGSGICNNCHGSGRRRSGLETSKCEACKGNGKCAYCGGDGKKKGSIAKKILSKIGTGAKIAGKGAMAGATMGVNAARWTGSTISDHVNVRRAESSGTGGLTILMLLAIAIHIMDMLSNFVRTPFNIPVTFSYVALVLLGIFLFNIGDHIDTKEFVTAVCVAYFLPFLKAISETFMKDFVWLGTLTGLIALIPPLVVYLAYKFPDESKVNKLARFYTLIWIFILLIYLFANFSNTQSIAKKSTISAGDSVKFVWEGIKGSTLKFQSTWSKSWNAAIAKATGQPDPGTIEGESGVIIESFKPLESIYTTKSVVYMQAKVKGTNLEDPIKATFSCSEPGIKTGETQPQLKIFPAGSENAFVDCKLGELIEGTHNILFESTFDMKTSSDITYTFVKYSPGMEIDDSKYKTQSDASKGPVLVSMTPADGAIRVYVDDVGITSSASLNERVFGVSLVNQWNNGRVKSGNLYIVKIPEVFTLPIELCNRPYVTNTTDPKVEDGRRIYTFKIAKISDKETYDSISCKLKLGDVNKLFILGSTETTETFTTIADYTYVLKNEKTINVEKG